MHASSAGDPPGPAVTGSDRPESAAWERALLLLNLALESCRRPGPPGAGRPPTSPDDLIPTGTTIYEWRDYLAGSARELEMLLTDRDPRR